MLTNYISNYKKPFLFFLKDINRAEASIGKFGKQIETFQADKAGWLKRFKDGKANLVQLKKQIVNDVSVFGSFRSQIQIIISDFFTENKGYVGTIFKVQRF